MSDDDDDLQELPARVPKKRSKAERGAKSEASRSKPVADAPASKPQPPGWVVGLVAILFMGPIIGFAVFMANRQETNDAAEAQAFTAEIEQLVQPPHDGSPPAITSGKFAVVDVNKRQLHHTHKFLWDNRRARTPATTDHLVQLQEVRENVATYTSGSKGIKVTYHITVLDRPTRTVIGKKTFVGSDPPIIAVGSKGPDSDVVGTPPSTSDLNDFYHGLVEKK